MREKFILIATPTISGKMIFTPCRPRVSMLLVSLTKTVRAQTLIRVLVISLMPLVYNHSGTDEVRTCTILQLNVSVTVRKTPVQLKMCLFLWNSECSKEGATRIHVIIVSGTDVH